MEEQITALSSHREEESSNNNTFSGQPERQSDQLSSKGDDDSFNRNYDLAAFKDQRHFKGKIPGERNGQWIKTRIRLTWFLHRASQKSTGAKLALRRMM